MLGRASGSLDEGAYGVHRRVNTQDDSGINYTATSHRSCVRKQTRSCDLNAGAGNTRGIIPGQPPMSQSITVIHEILYFVIGKA